MSMPFRSLAYAIVALVLVVAPYSQGSAQAPVSVPGKAAPAKAPPLPAVGEACTRTDGRRGLVAEDACGRKACVLKFGQMIPAAEKGLTRRVGCEWMLIEGRCECVIAPSKATKTSK